MKRLALIVMTLCFGAIASAWAQSEVGIKTNLLYGGYTFTPNLGLEVGFGKRTTLEISGGYNPWNLSGGKNNNKKLVHWLAQAEFHYFLCERFNGHFFGVHALGGQYNIAGHELPLLLGKGSKDFRFEGSALGAGVSYGYQWVLSRHWNVEFSIGVGYASLNYDKHDCPKCGEKLGSFSRSYFGPTKAGVSLIYLIK